MITNSQIRLENNHYLSSDKLYCRGQAQGAFDWVCKEVYNVVVIERQDELHSTASVGDQYVQSK